MEDFNLDDMLNSAPEPLEKTNNYNNYNNDNSFKSGGFKKGGNKNFYKKDRSKVQPISPDPTKFHSGPYKTFMIDIRSMTDDQKTTVLKIAETLFKSGFVYRSALANNPNMALDTEIRKLSMARVEGFKPWKNYKYDEAPMDKIVLEEPVDLAYQYAFNYNPGYPKLPDSVRTFLSRDIHMFMGADLLTPVNVLITYSTCGTTKFSKTTDFKVLGTASAYVKMAKHLTCPIFNLGSKTFLEEFKTYLKSITASTADNLLDQ